MWFWLCRVVDGVGGGWLAVVVSGLEAFGGSALVAGAAGGDGDSGVAVVEFDG